MLKIILIILISAFFGAGFGFGMEQREAISDSGRVFMHNRNYKSAWNFYRKNLQGDSENVDVHRSFQDAGLQADSIIKSQTVSYYKHLADSLPGPLNFYLVGRCLNCIEGIEFFQKALDKDSRFVWAHMGMGACFFEQKDYKKAARHFLRAIKINRRFFQAYHNLARVYTSQKKLKKAKKVYRKLVKISRSNPQIYEWLGDWYLEQEKHQLAEKAYKKCAEYGGHGPELFFKLGYSQFSAGKHFRAVGSYKKSVAAGSRRHDVYYNLGAVLEICDLHEEALHYYQESYLKSGKQDVLYSMGNCAVKLGLYSLAIEKYTGFLKHQPLHLEALFGLANAYQMKKDFQKAESGYKSILEKDSTFIKAHYNLGSIYVHNLADTAGMKHHWEIFVDLSPDSEESRYIRREMQKMGVIP